jgi:5-methylthioadenosine/S-adenosylhomocysteine deaminase
MLEEARFCALIHRASSHTFDSPKAEGLLRQITIEGARALRLDHQIGSLEAGKQADLIAIDLSRTHNAPIHDPATSIVFSAAASDVVFTEVAGQVLFDRELKTLDESYLKQQAHAALARMHANATHP